VGVCSPLLSNAEDAFGAMLMLRRDVISLKGRLGAGHGPCLRIRGERLCKARNFVHGVFRHDKRATHCFVRDTLFAKLPSPTANDEVDLSSIPLRFLA